MEGDFAFAVTKLSKADGYANVMKSVDLSVQVGEIHASSAANATRKSILIHFLPNTIAPDCGEISVCNQRFIELTDKILRQVEGTGANGNFRPMVAINGFFDGEACAGPFARRARSICILVPR